MDTHRKYSKSSIPYIKSKYHLLGGDAGSIKKIEATNQIYLGGPKRLNCKLCDMRIADSRVSFTSHGVRYSICKHCGHLNGEALETYEFVSHLYADSSGSNYSLQYSKEQWINRIEWVYRPKLDFLLEVLDDIESIPKSEISILDIGCGSGGFTYAASDFGIDVVGIDVNEELVEIGNQFSTELIGKTLLNKVDLERFYDEIASTKKKVVCALGVIEHLLEPNLLFEAFKKSHAEYLYYLVPMFSFSTILEVAFPEKFPRVLSGGHTHLFTEESIQKLHDIYIN